MDDEVSDSEKDFDNDFKLIKQIRKMIIDNLNRERIVYL